MTLFLTIDAGGTSTRAVVHDADGSCLGYAVGSGGNPTASGVETVAATMSSTTSAAIAQAGAEPTDIAHAFAAMAGSAAGMTGVDLGLRQLGVPVPLALGNDIEAMFFAGTAALDGIGLVSGTGAAAIVVRGGASRARSDGRGWLLGDTGSGYWIARRILRAVTADLDHRGPRTALTDALLVAAAVEGDRHTDKDTVLDRLVTAVYAIPTPGIARFAPLVFDLAPDDEVAGQIIDAAARGLADTALALPPPAAAAPLIVGGSVLYHQPGLRSRVAQLLEDEGRRGAVTAVADGTLGAICMNLRAAGHPVGEAAHTRIDASLREIRSRR